MSTKRHLLINARRISGFPKAPMRDKNHTHKGSDQSNPNCKHRRKNLPKSRNILAKKIGAIISNACGSRRKAQELFGKPKEGKGKPITKIRIWQVAALQRKSSKGRKRDKENSSKRRLTVSASLFRLRKWKTNNKPNNGINEEEAEEEGKTELELCKKRILMGGKCRPLNQSGALRYDKQGVLLPEE